MEATNEFPKVESPYYRSEDDEGRYVIQHHDGELVKPEYEWVFELAEDVRCVEKFDGTNVAVYLDDGEFVEAYTRYSDDPVDPWNPEHHYVARGIQTAIRRNYFQGLDGLHYGEVVGPHIQGNPHALSEYIFMPFERAWNTYQYESYGDYPTDYESIKGWLRGEEHGIFSLIASRQHNQPFEECKPKAGVYLEGVVFVHPNLDRLHPDHWTLNDEGNIRELAKLRRDMFPEYKQGDWIRHTSKSYPGVEH